MCIAQFQRQQINSKLCRLNKVNSRKMLLNSVKWFPLQRKFILGTKNGYPSIATTFERFVAQKHHNHTDKVSNRTVRMN